ncbi:MAG: hypothetical protein II458_01810 [Oscillospiraceae bacterium]|nr:hypothetical protein [Oscillospiraceae bacterium]
MIELKILVDNIDYDSLADVLVPLIAEKMKDGEKGGILGGILAKNPAAATSMAHTLLKTMSQQKRDEMLVQLSAKYRDKLLDKGRDLLDKRGLDLQLYDVSARII